MITIFKIFEQQAPELPNYLELNDDIYLFSIMSVFDYLKLDLRFLDEEKMEMKNIYNIDVIDFIKEILLNKLIFFRRKDKNLRDPITTGFVENVIGFYGYNYDVFLEIKLKTIEESYLIAIDEPIELKKYDANKKPLHKEMKILKDSEIYNL